MDTMQYAVLLKARNDLVERTSRLSPYPEALALYGNDTFQNVLDRLDPDFHPYCAQTPKEARIAYMVGEFHLEKTRGWFAHGGTMQEYRDWYFKNYTVW